MERERMRKVAAMMWEYHWTALGVRDRDTDTTQKSCVRLLEGGAYMYDSMQTILPLRGLVHRGLFAASDTRTSSLTATIGRRSH